MQTECKKKFQKEQVAKAAKVYSGQLRREVNAEREKLGKKPIEDDDDNENHPQNGGGSKETVEKTVSNTDPDCGMFVLWPLLTSCRSLLLRIFRICLLECVDKISPGTHTFFPSLPAAFTVNDSV